MKKWVNTFKRTLKQTGGVNNEEEIIQQFLWVYQVSFNKSTTPNMSSAKMIFARKIKTVFDKLLPIQKKVQQDYKIKAFNVGDKVLFKSYWKGKSFWQDGVIMKRITWYTAWNRKKKPYINQLWKQFVKIENQTRQEVQIEVL